MRAHRAAAARAAIAIVFGSAAAARGQAPCGAPLFPLQQVQTQGGASFVVTGDLDRDGRLDLVTGLRELEVLQGRGDGTFGESVLYGIVEHGRTFSAAVIEDFDGDGTLDVAATHYWSGAYHIGELAFLAGNGDGTLRQPLSFTIGIRPTRLSAADLDGDGKPDLVFSDSGDSDDTGAGLFAIFNTGEGTFSAPVALLARPGRVEADALGDLDGDGDPDLAVRDQDAGGMSIMLNKGDGSFGDAATIVTDQLPVSGITIGDLSGDGIPDLALARAYAGVGVLIGDGTGGFAGPVNYPGPEAFRVACGDLDGDGDADLVTQAAADRHVSILSNHGDGTFAPPVDQFSGHRAPAVIAEFNGDAALDLLVGLNVLLGRGDGSFGTRSLGLGRLVASADLDRDGALDLILAPTEYGGNWLHLVPGRSDGTFGPPVTHNIGAQITAVAPCDLDGDGDTDLAVGVDDEYGIWINLNDGVGHLTQVAGIYTERKVMDVAAADLDEDGHADLVASPWNTARVIILWGRGGGTFDQPVPVDTEWFPWGIATGDLDGDGDTDLAVSCAGVPAQYHDGAMSILLNGAGRSFTTAAHYRTSRSRGGPRRAVLCDLDGDGDLDAAAAHHHGTTSEHIAVLTNRGDGLFELLETFHENKGGEGIAAGDVDGDRRLDLVVGNGLFDHANLTIFPGRGDATFRRGQFFATLEHPSAPMVADLDRDGDLDVVAGDHGTSILMNDSCPGWDLDEDGETGSADALLLIDAWGPCAPWESCRADLDGDGEVGMADLLILLGRWSQRP